MGSIGYGSNEFRVIINYIIIFSQLLYVFRNDWMISQRNKLLNNPIEIAFYTLKHITRVSTYYISAHKSRCRKHTNTIYFINI